MSDCTKPRPDLAISTNSSQEYIPNPVPIAHWIRRQNHVHSMCSWKTNYNSTPTFQQNVNPTGKINSVIYLLIIKRTNQILDWRCQFQRYWTFGKWAWFHVQTPPIEDIWAPVALITRWKQNKEFSLWKFMTRLKPFNFSLQSKVKFWFSLVEWIMDAFPSIQA